MDRFESMQLFVRIVELGSFTQAAGALGVPRATATHAIKQLEERLGARLLERTTRQVRPTIGLTPAFRACLKSWTAPALEPWSVRLTAGISRSAARARIGRSFPTNCS